MSWKTIVKKKGTWDEEGFAKIDMDRYTDMAIRGAITSMKTGLESDKIESGFMLKVDAIDQLERILVARGLLLEDDPDYNRLVSAKKEQLNKAIPDGNNLLKEAKIANYKFGLLMQIVDSGELKEAELTV